MASVAEIAKKLNKEFKNNNLIIKANVQPQYERLATGAFGFDFPLFGGFPEGRVIQGSGKEGSGKTTAAVLVMAAYQRKYPEKTCAFVDIEHAIDMEFLAKMTGIDWTKVLYVNPENMSGEQCLDIVHELLTGDDIGMIIVDSVAAMSSTLEYDSDIEKDSGQAGQMAKPLHRFFRKSLDKVSQKKVILWMINQVREVGKTRMGAPILKEPCGSALSFYSSIILRFGSRTYTQGEVVDKYQGEKADGIRLWFQIQKNKTGSTQRGGGWATFRYDRGLDWSFDLLEIALRYEFISRPTSQSYLLVNLITGEVYKDAEEKELKFVGKAKVIEYFNNNPKFQKEYLEMLTKHISALDNQYGKLLDDRIFEELDQETKAVAGDYKDEE